MEYHRYQIVIHRSPDKSLLTLDEIARACRIHPEFILRLVELGLIEPVIAQSRYYFDARAIEDIGRARRLHDDLGINWPGVGLVMDLLDRVAELEAELARLGHLKKG